MDVVLWWHFHQPDYREPGGKTALFPWVRMHALRAYTDLVQFALDEDFRGMTINVVPSLFDQLEDLASGLVEDGHHRAARRLADGDDTAAKDAFFAHAAPAPTPVRPIPHLDELRALARRRAFERVEDAIDACVLFQLSWVGFTAAQEPLIEGLFAKGKDFTREELKELLALSRRYAGNVVPRLREAHAKGVIHTTTTPYAHPILPLLIDTSIAHEATHDGGAPPPFTALDDAHAHVRLAVEKHVALFGETPRAMWPAEGSLSEAALDVFKAHGVSVVASDEELLRKSLKENDREAHLSPWHHERTGLDVLFRDRRLSDDWGFVYRDLPPDDAANSFVDGCVSHRDRGNLVSVILDGENPFERFPEAGRAHLVALAKAAKGRIRLRPPEFASSIKRRSLTSLAPGSWIGASFDIWAGDDEDRRGWDVLAKIRNAIHLDALPADNRARALRHLLAAEGSDWFWWFGPEFQIPDKPGFDALFRRHLEEAVDAAGFLTREGLPRLDEPICGHDENRRRSVPPLGCVEGAKPAGPLSLWHDAIVLGDDEDQGSMHKATGPVTDLRALVTAKGASVRLLLRDDVTRARIVDVSDDTAREVLVLSKDIAGVPVVFHVPFRTERLSLRIECDAHGGVAIVPAKGAFVVERPSARFAEA